MHVQRFDVLSQSILKSLLFMLELKVTVTLRLRYLIALVTKCLFYVTLYERDSSREKGHHSLEQNENRHGIQTLSKGFSFSLLLLHIKNK